MIYKNNKKGVGHVEIIVSFVIFIGFLLFLFVIFNPFKNNLGQDAADSAYLKLDEKLADNITILSININRSYDLNLIESSGCFQIDYIPDLGCDGKMIVKNASGSIINAKIDRILGKIIIEFSAPANRFYTIYCSDELNERINVNSCVDIRRDDYALGIINNKKVWSTHLLNAFYNNYTTNYNQLREEIALQGTDFGFTITDINDQLKFKALKEIPKGVNVVTSPRIPINLLDENATISSEVLNIAVW
jgi:hypothetical protein